MSDDDTVEVRVAIPCVFTDDLGKEHSYLVGRHPKMPRKHAEHWFVKAHLEDYEPPPPPAGSADQARMLVEAAAQRAKLAAEENAKALAEAGKSQEQREREAAAAMEQRVRENAESALRLAEEAANKGKPLKSERVKPIK